MRGSNWPRAFCSGLTFEERFVNCEPAATVADNTVSPVPNDVGVLPNFAMPTFALYLTEMLR